MATPASAGFPIGQGYNTAQWVTWFKGFTANNPKMPKYTGNNTLARGKTWDQVYTVLYNYSQAHPPKGTPDQVAEAELELIQAQAVANGIGAGLTFTGTTVQIAGKSAVGGIDQLTAALQGPLAIFSDLTSANLWIRVAKVLIGGVILTVGLIELTGHSDTVKGVASKAVKTAPFLL